MEERREAAIVGRRSQNSERVRAHLYERTFRAKPVRRCDGARERGAQQSRIMRRNRRLSKTGAVRPDDWDSHLGRERPLPTGQWGDDRGVAGGVAHAPDPTFAAVDSRADCDTGGTSRRRPVQRSEVAHSEEHRQFELPGNQAILPSHSRAPRCATEGERCSRVCVPLSFSSLSQILTASRGERARSEARSPTRF